MRKIVGMLSLCGAMLSAAVVVQSSLASALGVLPNGTEDFWGRRLPDQPTNFIFAYGSLINTASRSATSAHPISAIPARISSDFGYIRIWNDRSPSRFTALGLRKPERAH